MDHAAIVLAQGIDFIFRLMTGGHSG